MKKHTALILSSLALLSLGITPFLHADDEDVILAKEKAYVEAYHNAPLENVAPVRVETPYIDPEILYDDSNAFVVVEFTVGPNGKPSQIKAVDDSDFALVNPVLDAVSNWRFRPAVRNGKAVSERVQLTIAFKENAPAN